MPYSRRPYTFDRVVRLIINIAIFLTALWLINTLKSVLLPFCVACLIAYIFEPFVERNRRLLHFRRRTPAVLVTLFEAAFLFFLAVYFIVPLIIGEITSMASAIRNYAVTETDTPYIPNEIHAFIKRNINFEAISDYVTKEQISSLVENAVSTSWNLISGSISMLISLFSWLVVVLYVVFIMIDYKRLAAGCRGMVPPRYRQEVFKLAKDIETSMNHYFRGQALVALIVGVLFSIGFYIIGLPMAIALGLFIGLLNMVPYLQLISFPVTAVLCLIYTAAGNGDFWSIFWQSMAVYIVVQAIQDLYLTPRIMGKAMGLNPAIILLSLSVWGSLLGFIGLIIGLPLTTLILAYYEEYIIRREGEQGETPSQLIENRRAIDEAFERPLD